MPWIFLSALLLIGILVPFFLFEKNIDALVERLTGPGARSGIVAIAVVLLLALDVLLPVPSSVVSTAAGAALGFLPGLLASTAGMTLGSILGYACGRMWGLPLTRHVVREKDLEHVSARFQQGAAWALAVMRPVPVLAEASSLFAGVAGVPSGAIPADYDARERRNFRPLLRGRSESPAYQLLPARIRSLHWTSRTRNGDFAILSQTPLLAQFPSESAAQQVVGDPLHARIRTVRSRPVRPWQHVTRRRGQSLRPEDRCGIKHKIVLRTRINRRGPARRSNSPAKRNTFSHNLEAWDVGGIAVKLPSD